MEQGGAVVYVGGACADAPVLGAAAGRPANLESLLTQLLYAAHDARLEDRKSVV